jgi:hypothetical protein
LPFLLNPKSITVQQISLYQYVASNDTYAAKAICSKYGYSLQNADTPEAIAVCLEQLVAAEGEPALRDIAALHPDKDLLVSLYGQSQPASTTEGGCGCKGKKDTSSMDAYIHTAQQNTGFSLQQGNTFLFAGVIILAVAIIATSK